MSEFISAADWQHPDYSELLSLRHAILRAPFGLDYTPKELEIDRDLLYFVYKQNEKIIGVVGLQRLDSRRAQLRQMAVAETHQDQGIGSELIAYAEDVGRHYQLELFEVKARCTAQEFYEKRGYQAYGDVFDEIGIPHICMRKRL